MFPLSETGRFSGMLPAQRPRAGPAAAILEICLRIKLSFGFWGRAVKAFDNFSRKLAWLLKTIF